MSQFDRLLDQLAAADSRRQDRLEFQALHRQITTPNAEMMKAMGRIEAVYDEMVKSQKPGEGAGPDDARIAAAAEGAGSGDALNAYAGKLNEILRRIQQAIAAGGVTAEETTVLSNKLYRIAAAAGIV